MAEQKNNILAEVQRRLGLEVVKHLEEKDVDDFSVLIKKEDVPPDEMLKFFRERVKNFDEVVKGVLEKFSKEFLADFKL